MRKTWSKPVILHGIGEEGEDVVVDCSLGASWALIEDWPEEEGEQLDKALLVEEAMNGLPQAVTHPGDGANQVGTWAQVCLFTQVFNTMALG